jgi:MoxR-like ATPase
VLATQNPIEQEGTYSLPEAQLDRFLLNIVIGYPTADEERQMLVQTTAAPTAAPRVVATGEDIAAVHALVREIPAASNVVDYASRLVRSTRPGEREAAPVVGKYVRWGAGPRAGQALLLCGKARALLDGRATVSLEDVQALALPVLRHRVLVNFQAEAEGLDADAIVSRVLTEVPART